MYVYLRKFICLYSNCLGASSGSGRLQIALNLDLRDGSEETAMGLALWTGQFDVARELLEAGEYYFSKLIQNLHMHVHTYVRTLNCVFLTLKVSI